MCLGQRCVSAADREVTVMDGLTDESGWCCGAAVESGRGGGAAASDGVVLTRRGGLVDTTLCRAADAQLGNHTASYNTHDACTSATTLTTPARRRRRHTYTLN